MHLLRFVCVDECLVGSRLQDCPELEGDRMMDVDDSDCSSSCLTQFSMTTST